MEKPPTNIGEVPGRCFDAVYNTNDQLVGLLPLNSLFWATAFSRFLARKNENMLIVAPSTS